MKKFLMAAGILGLALFFANASLAVPIPKGVGVNIHFTGAPTKDLDLIKNGGFNMARTDMKWDQVETTKGQYNWTQYDQLVDGLLSRGVTPYLILDYNNPVYGSAAMQGVRGTTQIQGYANFAKAAAAHFKGKQIIFEIWNEPNLDIFWNPAPNATDYMNMLKAAVPAMKAADPNCIVVAPAVAFVANTFDFLHGCCVQGLLGLVDGLSVHPYKDAAPESGTIDYLYNSLKGIVRDYGYPNMPIIGGEFGFSTVWSSINKNEDTQAQYLVRQLLMHDYYGVPVSIVYDFKNDGTDANNSEHNFGVLRYDYSVKPAYTAIKTMREALAGSTFSSKLASNSSDYLYEYTSTSGKTVAAWTTGATHNVTIYGKSVSISNMPVYVKDGSTTTTPPPTEPPVVTAAPVIDTVSLAIRRRTGAYNAVISWKESATNETGVEVYQSYNNQNDYKLVSTLAPVTTTGTTVTTAINLGTSPSPGTYYYKIVEKLPNNVTLTSNIGTMQIKAPVPASLTTLNGAGTTDTSNSKVVILNWVDTATDEDGFNIYFSNNASQSFSKIGTITKDQTLVVHPVNATGTFSYKVLPFNGSGEAENSPVTTVTVN